MPSLNKLTIAPAKVARQIREMTGLSADDAGNVVYVSGRMWRYWESGKCKMSMSMVELFCLKTNLMTVQQVLEAANGKKKRNQK